MDIQGYKIEDLAYCAGIIDADGTIGIKKNTYSIRVLKDSRRPEYLSNLMEERYLMAKNLNQTGGI